jgi:hypothetical protein
MTWTQTDAMTTAQLEGVRTKMDADPEPAYALVYDVSETTLVAIVLAQPSGSIEDAEMTLIQNDPAGDLIIASGAALTFELFAGDNTLLGGGSVSDMEGSGDMKIAGASGTNLFAGGRAVLGLFKLA